MVKLDNWQTKAEKAAERRNVSKQKKQQRDRTRLNKALAQQLLSFLDEHNDQILMSMAKPNSSSSSGSSGNKTLKVHFWTDMPPSSFDWIAFAGGSGSGGGGDGGNSNSKIHKNLFSIMDDNDDVDAVADYGNTNNNNGHQYHSPNVAHSKKGRPRSASLNISSSSNVSSSSPPPSTTKKGRARSNSDASVLSSASAPSSLLAEASGKKKKKKGGKIPWSGSIASSDAEMTVMNNSPNEKKSLSSPTVDSPLVQKKATDSAQVRLCANHFFGLCCTSPSINNNSSSSSTTTSGCSFGWHPCARQKNATLANVLLCNNNNNSGKMTKNHDNRNTVIVTPNRITSNKQTLELSLEAAITNGGSNLPPPSSSSLSPSTLSGGISKNKILGETNVGIDMLYHQSVQVVHQTGEKEKDTSKATTTTTTTFATRISEQITTILSRNSCSIGSMVYMVVGDILVYDRYRDGHKVLSDLDEEILLFGGLKRRSVSIGEYAEEASFSSSYRYMNNGVGSSSNNMILDMHDSNTDMILLANSSFTSNNSDNNNHHHNNILSQTVPESTCNVISPCEATTTTTMSLRQSVIEFHQRLVLHLPCQVLEYILSFLPEQATATMSLVCKSWYNEIGQSSPDLWRYLLNRNDWPMPMKKEEKKAIIMSPQQQQQQQSLSSSSSKSNNDDSFISVDAESSSFRQNCDKSNTQIYRDEFISHYTAVRDVKAIVQGLQMLESSKNNNCNGGAATAVANSSTNSTSNRGAMGSQTKKSTKDVALVHFKDVLGSKNTAGETFVRMWSENRALVANAQDCTVYLYDVVESNCGNVEYRCKQGVRVSVAPFRNTKKRSCTLVALDLDSRMLGCLYKVGCNAYDSQTWFGVVQRDNLLCTGVGGTNVTQQLENGSLCTYNLEAKVLDYITTCNDIDVLNFLYNHGQNDNGDGLGLSSVDVEVKENIVACGNGEFLFEASIIAPLSMDDDDAVDVALLKIFLFSSDFGKITWVGPHSIDNSDTILFDPMYPPQTSLVGTSSLDVMKDIVVDHHREESFGQGGEYPNAIFLSSVSPNKAITIKVIGPGDVQCTCKSRTKNTKRRMSGTNQWPEMELYPRHGKVAAVTHREIVYSESYYGEDDGGNNTTSSGNVVKTLFSFQPISGEHHHQNEEAAVYEGGNDNDKDYLIVKGNCGRYPTQMLRNGHILVFCENYNIDFENENDDNVRKSLLSAILIHIPSRKIVYNSFIGDITTGSSSSSLSSSSQQQVFKPGTISISSMVNNSMAVCIDEIGMFICGHGVERNLLSSSLFIKTDDEKAYYYRGSSDNKERKKKKPARQKGKKVKDGFARGMRQSMG